MITRLSVAEFGRALVTTGDLDPIYLMLEGAQLDRATLQRWCLAYWMFYHAGVASLLSEHSGADFWHLVRERLHGGSGRSPRSVGFPRGTERRHFRGRNADASVQYLSARFPAPEAAALLLEDRGQFPPQRVFPYTEIARRVQEWVGFGPWIAYKVADMLDAVLGVPVDFSDGFPGNVFAQPAKGAVYVVLAAAIQRAHGLDVALIKQKYEDTSPDERQRYIAPVFEALLHDLRDLRVPHRPQVPLRIQEAETVLCKWKSHLNGQYDVGKDTTEILHALDGWGSVADSCARVLRRRTFQ